jgi:hypothetical protein
MGLGLVILLHLVFVFILSSGVAFVSVLITYFRAKKEKRKRKIFLALFIPYQTLFTLYILALIGSGIVSGIKNVDIGTGDAWNVPLNASCQMIMIDIPEKAYIQCNQTTLMSDVIELQQVGEKVYGKVSDEKFFALSLGNNRVVEYSSEKELIANEHPDKLDLLLSDDFYRQRRWEVAGTATVIVGILSVVLTFMIVFVSYRLIMYGLTLGFKKSKQP